MSPPLFHTLVCHTCYLFGLLVVQVRDEMEFHKNNAHQQKKSGILASNDLTFNSAIVKHVESHSACASGGNNVGVQSTSLNGSICNPLSHNYMPHKLDQG